MFLNTRSVTVNFAIFKKKKLLCRDFHTLVTVMFVRYDN